MIDIGLLMRFGAKITLHMANEVIFNPNGHAGFLYHVVAGAVKLVTPNDDGGESVHGIYGDGQSFGMLMSEFQPGSSAIALEATSLVRLPNDRMLELLNTMGWSPAGFSMYLKDLSAIPPQLEGSGLAT